MEGERRRGMDDVAEAIGALRAGQAAITQRLEALALERQQQHAEALRDLTDIKAQIHEIKHTQNNDAVKFARLESTNAAIVDRLDGHQRFATEGLAKVEKEIITNREASGVREAAIISRIEELSAWRWWVRGALGVIGLALALWGHEVFDAASRLFSGPRGH